MGGNVASLDGANAETINFRNAGFWTGMAASKRQAVGIQEICRVSVQAVIGSVGSGGEPANAIERIVNLIFDYGLRNKSIPQIALAADSKRLACDHKQHRTSA